MGYPKYPKPEEQQEHAFKETRNLNPNDQVIRGAGFRILARPAGGLPTWIRGGAVYSQEQALRVARLQLESQTCAS